MTYAKPARHHVRENAAADAARSERIAEYCEARREAKLECLRSHLGDMGQIDPTDRSPEELHDLHCALLRDRIARLEGPGTESDDDCEEEDHQEEDGPQAQAKPDPRHRAKGAP